MEESGHISNWMKWKANCCILMWYRVCILKCGGKWKWIGNQLLKY